MASGPTVCQPTSEQLALGLFEGMACSWPTNKQFSVATLILKYEILHKIGVANCFPSTHMATISIALAQLIFISVLDDMLMLGNLYFSTSFAMSTPMPSTSPFAFLI